MDDRSTNENEKGGLPFQFRKRAVPEELQQENWKGVEAAIRRQAERTPVRAMPWRALMAVAAILLVVAGIWYIQSRTGTPQIAEIKTGFGEVKHILLPDSSIVILNANSSMRIPEQWTDEDKDGRQVWLEGEAYFEVQKKAANSQKFVVHTDQVDVIVLGTRFNVNTRRQHAIVALEEGKVQLSVHGSGSGSVIEKPAPVVLRPGQVVVIGQREEVKVNTDKDVTIHSGWSRNEFHFDNTSLSEIGRLIEDNYGYKIEVSDTTLLERSVSGDLRAANVQELVRVLEFTLKLTMRIENKTIYVTNP